MAKSYVIKNNYIKNESFTDSNTNSNENNNKIENDIKKEAMMFELELCGGQLDDFECTLEDLEKEIIAERKLMKE
jgi:DNA replication protein DnaD